MSEQVKSYGELCSNLYSSFVAAEKNVNITIDKNDLAFLKEADYKLCFAKKVEGVYTVVWHSSDKYIYKNVFLWTPIYQLFGTNKFRENAIVRAITNTVTVGLGKMSTLNVYGVLSEAVTGGSEISINLENKYGAIHPCLNQLYTSFTGEMVSMPIYVADKPALSGTVGMIPKEQVLVWFEQNIETSTMISTARSNSIELDLTSVPSASVTYQGGRWKKS